MRRGVAASKHVITTRTMCATTTGVDNIPTANNDNDFMPSPLAHLHSPSPVVIDDDVVVTCCSPSPPPDLEPQFTFVWDQR
jgi:hypothetical protein